MLPPAVDEAEGPYCETGQGETPDDEFDGVGQAEDLAARDAPKITIETGDLFHATASKLACLLADPFLPTPGWVKITEESYLRSLNLHFSARRAMKDNPERSRFELDVEGDIVFASYRMAQDRVLITHVEAPVRLRGTGAASRLMHEIAEHARVRGLKLTPLCSYAAVWFRRNRVYSDVLS